MLKRFIVGVIAAGAVSVPLAGVAFAAPGGTPGAPGTPGGNGNGNDNGNGNGNSLGAAGGVPGSIQNNYGLSAPVPPGQWLGQLKANPGGVPLPQYLSNLTNGQFGSPGAIISGIAHGTFPPSDLIPAPVAGGTPGGGGNNGNASLGGAGATP